VRVAWTGHRPELFAHPSEAAVLVRDETRRLWDELGPDLVVLSGGQRGVDLWAALAARDLELRLRLYLPAPAALLSAEWPTRWAEALTSAQTHAEQLVVCGQDPRHAQGYEARNVALATECELLVAVWTGQTSGGTWHTISEARRLGRPIRQHLLERSAYAPRPGERGI
jgi:hypothetical protein